MMVSLTQIHNFDGPARRIMTLGLGGIWNFADSRFDRPVYVAAGIGFAGLLALRKSKIAAVSALLFLALISSVSNNSYLKDIGEIADGQVMTSKMLEKYEGCLGPVSYTHLTLQTILLV